MKSDAAIMGRIAFLKTLKQKFPSGSNITDPYYREIKARITELEWVLE